VFSVRPVDERQACLRPPQEAEGARLCYDEEKLFAKSARPVCLVDGEGRLYLAGIQSGKWLKTTTWTTSGIEDRLPDTLTAEQRARCQAVMQALQPEWRRYGPDCP
jgi:hypothetical protein